MEQLISAATLSTTICSLSGIFAVVILAITLAVFSNFVLYNDKGKKKIIKGMKKEKQACCLFFAAFLLSTFLFGFNFQIVCKCNKEASNIVRKVVAKNYPDATDFIFNICNDSNGSFSENGVDYQIAYKKTVNGKKKLVVTTDDNNRDIDNNGTSYDLPED